MHKSARDRVGFTLIELSVVLLIIGLIAGSILVGRDLIKIAQIRKAISQEEEMQTAMGAFKLKYGQLPGDCQQGSDIWPDAVNGNANGFIEGGYNDFENPELNLYEAYNMWHHLMRAELVPYHYVPVSSFPLPAGQNFALPLALENTYLTARADKVISVSLPYTNYFMISGVNLALAPLGFLNYLLIYSGMDKRAGLLPVDAKSIDTKIDDGKPFSGQTLSLWTLTDFPDLSCTPTNGKNAYDVKNPNFNCGVFIRFAQ